jgi:hypothetical protein
MAALRQNSVYSQSKAYSGKTHLGVTPTLLPGCLANAFSIERIAFFLFRCQTLLVWLRVVSRVNWLQAEMLETGSCSFEVARNDLV